MIQYVTKKDNSNFLWMNWSHKERTKIFTIDQASKCDSSFCSNLINAPDVSLSATPKIITIKYRLALSVPKIIRSLIVQ